jgi:predicted phage baseplate assembly protein
MSAGAASATCAGCGARMDCGCECGCNGAEALSLAAGANRPGLSRIDTRIGGHGAFFAAATRALSSADAPALRTLGTRETDDPAIALLDGWAMIADVLTFYRDRFSNETYLRTAREERSLRELAAQVGYAPRPGVSASVALAYLLDPGAQPVTISAGARVQSVPKPGEQMQSFETMQPLEARAEWSEMAPRQNWLPPIDRIDALLRSTLRLAGAQTVARPGERLLMVFGSRQGWQVVREVAAVKMDIAADCVLLTLKPRLGLTAKLAGRLLAYLDKFVATPGDPSAASAIRGIASYFLGASAYDAKRVVSDRERELYEIFDEIVKAPRAEVSGRRGAGLDAILAGARTLAGRVAAGGPRAVTDALGPTGLTRTALLTRDSPAVGAALYSAWSRLPVNDVTASRAPDCYLLRLVAGAFGSNAPALMPDGKEEVDDVSIASIDRDHVFLDALVDGVQSGGFALMDAPATSESDTRLLRLGRVREVQATARSNYGLTARVTRLDVVGVEDDEPLGLPELMNERGGTVRLLRQILYAVQSEAVTLAPEPLDDLVEGDTIMLDTLYPDLAPGRAIVVKGERADIMVGDNVVPGVAGGEQAKVAAVTQEAIKGSPGDTPHTVLRLTAPLTFRYRRAATTVHGNVVIATHGETVQETLGSGDASQAFQRFALRRTPLTFVAAPTTSGVADTLRLEVNGVALGQVDALIDAGPNDRVYQLSVDAGGVGTAESGDGKTGMRLSTGAENVRATYRVGIGTVGNVDPGQISLATTRPLGVRGVVNPLSASGGANRDDAEAIRRNTPVPTIALSPQSRLVSAEDYEHFARAFAGIGDVRAAMLSDGRHRTVFVTIAGIDDAAIAPDDLLTGALTDAYARYGDPALPVVVAVRERVTLLVQANVAPAPEMDRVAVDAAVRARLAEAFSFARRGLARPAYRSELIALIQGSPGVDHVDVDVFGGISDAVLQDPARLADAVHHLREQAREGRPLVFVPAAPARVAPLTLSGLHIQGPDSAAPERLLPAQTTYLRPDVPGTLILNWS